jgi:uncharacterized protein YqeY
MSIREKLSADLKDAMRSGDTITRDTIRLLQAHLQATAQDKKDDALKKGKPVTDLTEDEVITAITKYKKDTEEELEGQAQRGNTDRVKHLDNTRAVIMTYLPEQLSYYEITALVTAAINNGAKNQGEIRKAIGEAIKGKADNKIVSEVITLLLGNK